MILKDQKVFLETSGLGEERKMRIKPSAKIFNLLTKNLYSDIHTSLLRELGCNAADAMIQAGKKDKPFYVSLPNSLDPNLVVRDEGRGMSEEEMYEIYMVLGESNKTNDNDTTGCYGIGSKVIYSYCSTLSLTVRSNGKETVYGLYIADDGLPAYSKVYEKDTTESNGFEIKLPIKKEDFQRFAEAASKVFSWFNPRPIVTGNSSFRFENRDYVYQTNDFGILKSSGLDSHVVMGNVAYKIDSYSMGHWNFSHKDLVDYGIDLFAPIGSIEFTANREQISYTQSTKDYINKALTQAVDFTRKEISKEFDTMTNRLEIRQKLHEVGQSGLYRICKINSIVKNGETIKESLDLVEENNKYKDAQNPSPIHIEELRKGYRAGKNKLRLRYTQYLPCHKNTKIIVSDLPRGNLSRVRNFYLNNNVSSDGNEYYFATHISDAFIKKEQLEPLLIYTSKLDKPTSQPRVTAKAAKSTLYKYKGLIWNSYASESWEPEVVDIAAGGIYVVMERFYFEKQGTLEKPQNLEKIITLCTNLSGKAPVVYGIRKSDETKILNSKVKMTGIWIKLDAYVDALLNQNKNLEKYLIKENLHIYTGHSLNNFSKDINKLNSDNPIVEFLNEIKDIVSLNPDGKYSSYKDLCGLYNRALTADYQTISDKLGSIVKNVNSRYPLLVAIGYNLSSYKKDMINYMNLVDSSLAKQTQAKCQQLVMVP